MRAIREIGFKRLIKYIFFTVWETVFNLLLFSPLRACWMRLFGACIGKDNVIGAISFRNLYRGGLAGLKIGDHCFLGDRVVLDLADEIILENNVTLSDEVFVLTHTNVGFHNHPLQKFFPAYSKRVVFKEGSFVGIRATILPGVIVGKQSAIGACSLVKHDVPDHELHFGSPAIFKRKLQ